MHLTQEALVPPRRAVLLWDMDNVAGKGRQQLSLVQFLSASVAHDAPRIAAARRATYRRMAVVLSEFDIELISGGVLPSGADRRLCERARDFARLGHRQFVVVSNDGYFRRLAQMGEVHVVTMDPTHLSRRLAMAASTISVLSRDESGWSLDPPR